MTTVAETMAAELADAGIEKVFGLPGGEIVEILDELRKRDIAFILVRNEPSAVFMADAYARAKGKPAVCMTTLGPGAANAIMGVAHCHLDRSPVVIITAQKPESMLDEYTHQVLDLHALFEPITKASVRIHAGNAYGAVRNALALAASTRPGPVHLQVSAEDAVAVVDEAAAAQEERPVEVASIPPISGDDIDSARSVLSRSRRPLIVAGLGLEPQRPYRPLRALAEALRAPVITTPKIKGALADDHPLYAGTIGLTRTDPVYELVDEADCVVALGFDVVELVKPWDFDRPLIWIAPWANEDPSLKAHCEIVGDLAEAIVALGAEPHALDNAWGEARVHEFRNQPQPSVPPAAPGRITPQTVLKVMRKCAARDAFLAVDVGSHKIFSSLEWPASEPNRFLVSNGLSSMGFALPAAVGAAEADPDAQVLCLTGDAGLAMNVGELGVLAERRLPVVVVALNDGAIDLIRSHQQRAGKPIFGTEFSPPRFDQVASAFGLASRRVGDEAAFSTALSEYLAARSPALIEVMLDPTGYPTTPRNTTSGSK